MKKTTFISLLLVAASVIGIIGYSMGIFDNSPSSVSIETDIGSISFSKNTSSVKGLKDNSLNYQSKPKAQITANYLTPAELKKHSTKDDCWIIINGNIYNLTSYILQHPGGQNPILRACGGDGSSEFNKVNQHLMPFVQEKMKDYLLGDLLN